MNDLYIPASLLYSPIKDYLSLNDFDRITQQLKLFLDSYRSNQLYIIDDIYFSKYMENHFSGLRFNLDLLQMQVKDIQK